MSDTIGNGKISGLIAYLNNLSAKGKVKTSAITPLKSAVKTVFSVVEGEHWQDIDTRSINLDNYINRFKNLTIGKYDSASYNAYRARVSRVLGWYSHFLQDPGWTPLVKDRKKNDRTQKTPAPYQKLAQDAEGISEGEVVSLSRASTTEQLHKDAALNVTTKLISFPFPLSNGTIATLYLPQNLSPRDSERLQAFIKTLVIDEGVKHEA